jgi:AraC family transcriptional activator of pobA
MGNIFRFNSLSEFHEFCNLPKPEHPLISLIDYSKVRYAVDATELKWTQNFYSIGLKRNVTAKFNYGQQQYDFDSGVLTFISPMQFLSVEMNPEAKVEPTGWLLLIHQDFLWNAELAKKIKSYDFFKYSVNEALFLSEKEEQAIVEIMQNIKQEYESRIDKFSQELIIAQIERLLIYSERFYERQFVTRKKTNLELLARFEQVLANSFDHETLTKKGIPSVTALAEQMNISPNYLGSLLRIYTKNNTQQHVQNRLIEYAKERLTSSNLSASEIAYELGFEHSQSFSKLFKQKTDYAPIAFRKKFS